MLAGVEERLQMNEGLCASLPSSKAAYRLVAGDISAVPAVLGTMAGRAGLLAIGMYAFGARDRLVLNALGGALAIEAFVLGHAAYRTYWEKP